SADVGTDGYVEDYGRYPRHGGSPLSSTDRSTDIGLRPRRNDMTAEPRQIVLSATDHLASRLDGIIARVIAPHVNGLAWTAVLVELDKLKGKRPSSIAANDLQAQLRMLTERLGGLGYPFDDESRTVSTVASHLRSVRRNLAHTNPFSTL